MGAAVFTHTEPKYQAVDVVEKRLREDIESMAKVIRESGIKAE